MRIFSGPVGVARRTAARIRGQWSRNKRFLATAILIIIAGAVAYSAYVSTVDGTGFGILSESASKLWVKIGPPLALLLVLFRPLWQAAQGDGHLRHHAVSESDRTDQKKMAHFMKRADEVTIYSGDFSYIYDLDDLYFALKDLAQRGNLTLISYKSESVVKASSDAARGGKDCLISILSKSGKIHFDVQGRAKFSVIYRGGEEVLLYRHRDGGADWITVLRANNGMSKQLVEMIKTLTNVAVTSSAN